jgi:hypothetical protein
MGAHTISRDGSSYDPECGLAGIRVARLETPWAPLSTLRGCAPSGQTIHLRGFVVERVVLDTTGGPFEVVTEGR